MISTIIVVALFGLSFNYFLNYRDWLDLNKDRVTNIRPGSCETVIKEGGSEDLAHIGNGIVLLSSGFRFIGPPGKIKALDLNNENKVITLNMTNTPARTDFLASPHGITTWRDPETDQLFLYVVSHPASEDHVEVFEVLNSLTLNYVRTITDPMFGFMNDLVAVGKDKFYITMTTKSREFKRILVEMSAGLKFGGVYYYDGHRAREVVSGYYMPNGINISPDKKVIYVAEWGTKTLRGLRRESTNDLIEIWATFTGTGMDNIEVDPDSGDLWIGSQPVTWRTLNLFGATVAPSQVLRVKMRDNAVSDMEIIYQDDGAQVTGCSVATFATGKLVIGTVSKQAVVCDVKYLSPN